MENIIKSKIYTYNDYIHYSENERVEIIDGHIYAMAPAPSRIHQEIISKLITRFNNYIESNKDNCKVYPTPFDVFLLDDENIQNCNNIVQPDISIICDKNKLTDKGCTGAPDMIIEVVSAFNPSNDYVRKLSLYERYGIKEYWIVNPINQTIFTYKLDKNLSYAAPEPYTFKDKIKVGIYDNLFIDFSLFEL